MSDRELPLDRETRVALEEAKKRLSFPPFKFFRSSYYSFTVQVFLTSARIDGTKPDPEFRPPRENHRPVYPLHLDTEGIFDELGAPEVASILRAIILPYTRAPLGTDTARNNGRPEEEVVLPESLLRDIAVLAVRSKRTGQEELTRCMDAAIPGAFAELPEPDDAWRPVRYWPEPKAYRMCRERALETSHDLDQLLARHLRRVVDANLARVP